MKTIVESSSAGEDPGGSARNSGLPGGQPSLGAEGSLPDASQHGTRLESDLAALVEQEVSRRFQSVKDKRWAQLEKQYRELSTLREDADALLAAVSAAEATAGADPGAGSGRAVSRQPGGRAAAPPPNPAPSTGRVSA